MKFGWMAALSVVFHLRWQHISFFLEPDQSTRSDVVENQIGVIRQTIIDALYFVRIVNEYIGLWYMHHNTNIGIWYSVSITTYWFVIHSEKYIRKTNKSICIRNTLFWGLFHLTGSDRVQNAKELMLGHQSYFDTLTVNQMPQLRIWLELTLSSHYNCPLLFTSLIS